MLWFLLLSCLVVLNSVFLGSACPVGCICHSSQGGKKLKADCTGRGFKDIVKTDFLVNVTQLDLSNNDITTIRARAFAGHKTLKKLILSNNKIANIDPGAFLGLDKVTNLDLSYNELTGLTVPLFRGLKRLKQLDLSHNKLNIINGSAFTGLKSLKKLYLSSNKIITLPEGTFNKLTSLKKIDLSSNDLLCDCQLRWLVKYRKAAPGRTLKGMCQYPKDLERWELSRIKAKSLKCGKLQLPFTFSPRNSLVVMYGDSITLTCATTWIPGLRINWYKDTKLLIPGTKTAPWRITFETTDKERQVISRLAIAKLNTTDSGNYQCNVSTAWSFNLGQARINVLFGNSMFCRAEVTKTKKGEFFWENTDIGVVSQLTCPAGPSRVLSQADAVAKRACSREGKWMAVEDSQCAYDDRFTQNLYSLNQIGVNDSTVLAVSKALLNVTSHASRFTTPQDVIYTARILRRIQAHANTKQQIAAAIVEIVSNMMNVKKEHLAVAQATHKSCSSLLAAMDHLADLDSSFLLQRTTTNIGIDMDYIFPAAFQGKTCAAFFDDKSDFKSTLCNLLWKNATEFIPSRPLEASIHLPPYIFGKRSTTPVERNKMTFIVYRNSSLFPNMRNGSLQDTSRRVVSSVVCLNFGMEVANITSPLAVKFRNLQVSKTSDEPRFAAYWDVSGEGGHGVWLNNTQCTLQSDDTFTVSRCTHVEENTCFAIMELVKRPVVVAARTGDDGILLEPIVYIGAAVCVLLLLITLFTYIMFRQLRYNRDDAAMLMNECLALVVVLIIYVAGVNRATNPLMCRAIGVLLHYFLLCCLFWVGCGGLCLCRLIKTTLQPEEFNPVLRYYMISWGIPLIICGITVAGNPENYNVENYCWLKPNPFLGAFLGPACLVIVIDIFMYIRLHCLVKSVYSLKTREQENQEPLTRNTDDHLSEALTSKCELIENIQALPDKEEIRAYQQGSLLVLLLIVINFVLGFLIVRFQEPKYLNLALSCVFAITVILLGLVVFLFHCYKNPKARKFWTECFGRTSCNNKKYIIEQEEVENLDAPPGKGKLMNGDAGMHGNGGTVHRIHGAPSTTHGSDIQSNVSLPSSAALTIDRPLSGVGGLVVENPAVDQQSVTACSDRHSIATSVSDKHSCVSAPLPLDHALPKLREHPPGYRYSYHVPDAIEFKRVKPKRKERKAPIALPERNGITSSLESSLRSKSEHKDKPPPKMTKTEPDIPESAPSEMAMSEVTPSEVTPSEVSCVREPVKFLEPPSVPYSSCASSDVSIPGLSGDMQSRPPIPGAPNHNAINMAPPHTRMKPPMDRFQYNVFAPRGSNFPNSARMPKYPTMPFPRSTEYAPRYIGMPGFQNSQLRHPVPRPPLNNEQQIGGEGQHPANSNQNPNGPMTKFPPRPDQNVVPGPSAGVPRQRTFEQGVPNGSTNEQLPRRRPRGSSDRPRTSRRNREGGSQPRTKDPSVEGGTRPKPTSRYGSRTSQTSWKDERQKPEPKAWVAEPVSRVTYVPIPHFIDNLTKQQDHNETSV